MKKRLVEKFEKIPAAAKAGFVFLVCAFLQKGISTLTTPIFTRLLSTEEYGSYNVYVSWSSIIAIFITLKIPSSVLQQAYVKFSDEKKQLASSMQGLSLVLCLLATVIYVINTSFWNKATGLTTDVFLVMILGIWATNVYEIWAQGERTNFQWKKVAAITVLTTILKPTCGIIAILLFPEQKVNARIFSLVAVEVIAYIGLFFSQLEKGNFYVKKFWKYALVFAIPLIPHYLSQQVLSQTDRLMINAICGAGDAGIYSLAYQVAMVMTLFNSAMSSTLNPWIYKQIKNRSFEKIAPTVEILMALLMALSLSMIIFAPEIIAIFAPSSYYAAIWAIPPVAMSCVFMFLYSVFVCFEFYYEKRSYIVYASVAGAALNVILNAIMIPIFGYVAASYTTLICYIVFCVMHFIFMRKTCKISDAPIDVFPIGKLIVPSVAYILGGLVITLLYNALIARVLIFCIVIVVLVTQRKKIVNILIDVRKSKK